MPSATTDTNGSGPAVHTQDTSAKFDALLRKRLRKFKNLLPKVLAEDQDAVHDLRVETVAAAPAEVTA